MSGWLNWREIERMNAWGIRRKDDAAAYWWDADADGWAERNRREGDAGEKQVALMERLEAGDTLLDVGCGAGALTIPAAKRVKRVYALDSSKRALEILMEEAAKQGLNNIVPICGNWYNMKAGEDYPVCDVAMGRHAPFQNDIIGFCSAATKYCYSLWNVADLDRTPYHANEGVNADTSKNPRRLYNEPNGRLFGFNVHFNLLYDAGANPEVQYYTNVSEYMGNSPEEAMGKMFPGMDISKMPVPFFEMLKGHISEADGKFILKLTSRMSILGWNPGEVTLP